MTTITPPGRVIVGVDTHKNAHSAVAINDVGALLDSRDIPATQRGYEELLAWARNYGPEPEFGVEGTGSYGMGLTRFLCQQGQKVVEVNRPSRQERRQRGKSDVIDAEQAARQVLAGTATAEGKPANGPVEVLRLVKIERSGALKARTETMITLKATLETADSDLREALEPLTDYAFVSACAQLDAAGQPETKADAMRYALNRMARRWLALKAEVQEYDRDIDRLTMETAPQLRALRGVGPQTSVDFLVVFGDRPRRIRSEAAFAKICGVCPIPASSGNTTRHRLNRGGNRQANASLHRIVAGRLRWHEETQAYVARRKTEGLSKREAIRCLKRNLPARSIGA